MTSPWPDVIVRMFLEYTWAQASETLNHQYSKRTLTTMASMTSIAVYSLLCVGEYAMSDQVPCDADRGRCDAAVSNPNAPVLLQGERRKTPVTMKINGDEVEELKNPQGDINSKLDIINQQLQTLSDSARRVRWFLGDSGETCDDTCRSKDTPQSVCSEDHWHVVASEDATRAMFKEAGVDCGRVREAAGTDRHAAWRPYVCQDSWCNNSCEFTTNTILNRCTVTTGYTNNKRLCPCVEHFG